MSKELKMKPKSLNVNTLKEIKDIKQAVSNTKMAIADVEIQKQRYIDSVNGAYMRLREIEQGIKAEFGENAIINLQTGEITYPKDSESKKSN